MGLAHLLCWLLRVRVTCETPERLREPIGFVFPNHLSLLDPLVLMTLTPLRFVSAVEVLSYPILGWMAKVVGTVFVTRQDRDARKQARNEIALALQTEPQPPIVLFPEGRLGPGASLYPFRFGAFAIAAEDEIAYVPCGLRYRPLDVVIWHGAAGETLMSALWRLALHRGSIRVDVLPLPVVQPRRTDSPEAMAQQAQIDIARVLELPLTPATPPQSYNWHEPAA
jgi:1-acyl-sn-glycerol-3-phosphate acyltransferase